MSIQVLELFGRAVNHDFYLPIWKFDRNDSIRLFLSLLNKLLLTRFFESVLNFFIEVNNPKMKSKCNAIYPNHLISSICALVSFVVYVGNENVSSALSDLVVTYICGFNSQKLILKALNFEVLNLGRNISKDDILCLFLSSRWLRGL